MDWARGFRAWLFPVLLGISALLHFMMARSFLVHLGPQKIEFARGETTDVFLIEETPPLLEPILEPIPEAESPPEIPAPPNADEILTTNQSEEVAAAQPTPELKKTEKKPAPQVPKTVSASQKTNIPQPVVILNTPPNYPETARRAGWEGRVTVRVEVSADGVPTTVTLGKSSGYGVLDQAALRAVKSWRFQPRTIGGVAMAGVVEVPVHFALNR
jgi:protein TonB